MDIRKEEIIISNVANWIWSWANLVGRVYGYLVENEPDKVKKFVIAHMSSALGVMDKMKEQDYGTYRFLREYLKNELNK